MSHIECPFEQAHYGEEGLRQAMMQFLGSFASSGDPNAKSQHQRQHHHHQQQQQQQQQQPVKWPLFSKVNATLWLAADAPDSAVGEHGMRVETGYKHSDCTFWASLEGSADGR
jgi:hypothetical protein